MWHVSGLEGEMISQGVWAVDHELVAAIPVKEATLDGTDTSDSHVPGDLPPKRRPALLTGVAVPWRLWAEKAFPHMQHVAFPIGVFFLVNIHQVHLFLLGVLHAGDAKLPHSHVGPKKVVETGATVHGWDHRLHQLSSFGYGGHEHGQLISLSHFSQIRKIIAQPIFPFIQPSLFSFKHTFPLASPLLVFFFLMLRIPMITRALVSVMLIIPRTGARGDLQAVITQLVIGRWLRSSSCTSGHASRC